MLIAVITDLHIGVRNDSLAFDRYFEQFYDKVFFPFLKEHKIDTVIDLGDTFDRRKYINYLTLQNCKRYYFDQIVKNNMRLHIIAGNHDIFYKNTNEINALDLLLPQYKKNILIYKDPQEIIIDGVKIALVPWITPNNFEATMELIKNTSSTIVFGHLEIAGFEMYRGQKCEVGLNKKVFDKFELVASGHFHHRSKYDNIWYLGAPYEMVWSDFDDDRGFHVFDTSTRNFSYIKNPFSMFHKISYDDSHMNVEQILNQDFKHLNDTFVKLIIKNKTNPYCFDLFVDKLEMSNIADLQIVEDHLNLPNENIEMVDVAEDTLSILRKYVDQLDIKTDKKKLSNLLQKLYIDAVNIDK